MRVVRGPRASNMTPNDRNIVHKHASNDSTSIPGPGGHPERPQLPISKNTLTNLVVELHFQAHMALSDSVTWGQIVENFEKSQDLKNFPRS